MRTLCCTYVNTFNVFAGDHVCDRDGHKLVTEISPRGWKSIYFHPDPFWNQPQRCHVLPTLKESDYAPFPRSIHKCDYKCREITGYSYNEVYAKIHFWSMFNGGQLKVHQPNTAIARAQKKINLPQLFPTMTGEEFVFWAKTGTCTYWTVNYYFETYNFDTRNIETRFCTIKV